MELKRKVPDEKTLSNRRAMLSKLKMTMPSADEFYGLEGGNKKTGKRNGLGEVIYVWNLPPVVTCPGASDCLHYCYNADLRFNVYPIEKWRVNWYWVEYRRDEAIAKINEALSRVDKPVVRVHSSGDFYSSTYTMLWHEIAQHNCHAMFWAYTRSWKIPEILPSLEILRANSNFQIFASIDQRDTFDKYPSGWRTCYVGKEVKNDEFYNCPEQYSTDGTVTCSTCRHCYTASCDNIYFTMH